MLVNPTCIAAYTLIVDIYWGGGGGEPALRSPLHCFLKRMFRKKILLCTKKYTPGSLFFYNIMGMGMLKRFLYNGYLTRIARIHLFKLEGKALDSIAWILPLLEVWKKGVCSRA